MWLKKNTKTSLNWKICVDSSLDCRSIAHPPSYCAHASSLKKKTPTNRWSNFLVFDVLVFSPTFSKQIYCGRNRKRSLNHVKHDRAFITFEILDRFDLQLLCGIFITHKYSLRMLLESWYSPHVIYSLFYGIIEGKCFMSTCDKDHDLKLNTKMLCVRSAHN